MGNNSPANKAAKIDVAEDNAAKIDVAEDLAWLKEKGTKPTRCPPSVEKLFIDEGVPKGADMLFAYTQYEEFLREGNDKYGGNALGFREENLHFVALVHELRLLKKKGDKNLAARSQQVYDWASKTLNNAGDAFELLNKLADDDGKLTVTDEEGNLKMKIDGLEPVPSSAFNNQGTIDTADLKNIPVESAWSGVEAWIIGDYLKHSAAGADSSVRTWRDSHESWQNKGNYKKWETKRRAYIKAAENADKNKKANAPSYGTFMEEAAGLGYNGYDGYDGRDLISSYAQPPQSSDVQWVPMQRHYVANSEMASMELLMVLGVMVALLCLCCSLLTCIFGGIGGYLCGRFDARGAAEEEDKDYAADSV